MSNNLEMKKTVVAGIKEKFEKAQTVVLVDYRGLTVAEDTELRNQLRKAGVEYAVLKNTMISRAIEGMNVDEMHASLEGPTAVAFGYEGPYRKDHGQHDELCVQVRVLRRGHPQAEGRRITPGRARRAA